MATFKPTIIKGNAIKDGKIDPDKTFNCTIRVTHNRKSKYIKTAIYVSKSQLTKSGDIKDPTVLDALNTITKSYRDKLVKIADRINLYDIDSLIDYVTRSVDDIDFIAYGRAYIERMTKAGSRSNYRTALNALVDYRAAVIPISSINANFLRGFERYLLSVRTMERVDRWGVKYKAKEPPVSPRSLFNYMNAIKSIFNAARLEYNNEDVGDIRIPFYPFRTYIIPSPGRSKKRNLSVDQVRAIRDAEGFARDVFMISFYLCGMNTVDIYNASIIREGRLEYNRSKTEGKRNDGAFISIRIEPELAVLINKYKDPTGQRVFNFHTMYKESRNFTTYVNRGLKKIIPNLTTYYARHSWATIARNDCGVAKDVVSEALNHSSGISVTDIYLARDWSAIDRANRAVIDLISGT